MRVFLITDPEIRRAIVRIPKINTVFKLPLKKLFAVENTYYDTSQTDKTSHQEISSHCFPVNCEYL